MKNNNVTFSSIIYEASLHSFRYDLQMLGRSGEENTVIFLNPFELLIYPTIPLLNREKRQAFNLAAVNGHLFC